MERKETVDRSVIVVRQELLVRPESRGQKDLRDLKDQEVKQELLDLQETRENREFKDSQDIQELSATRVIREPLV